MSSTKMKNMNVKVFIVSVLLLSRNLTLLELYVKSPRVMKSHHPSQLLIKECSSPDVSNPMSLLSMFTYIRLGLLLLDLT